MERMGDKGMLENEEMQKVHLKQQKVILNTNVKNENNLL